MFTDILSLNNDVGRIIRQFIRAYETLADIDEVDVGTAPKTVVYGQDKIRLFHYQNQGKTGGSRPTLIVYALVNRHNMLDLQPDRSIVRNLLNHGLDLFLIDWGYPDQSDKYLTMDDYINGYLDDCLDFVRRRTGFDQINLIGICQGGTFSVIYSALHPQKVKNLTTIVSPVDFSGDDSLLFKWSKHFDVDTIVDAFGIVPADFLNLGFMMLKPFARLQKYSSSPGGRKLQDITSQVAQ